MNTVNPQDIPRVRRCYKVTVSGIPQYQIINAYRYSRDLPKEGGTKIYLWFFQDVKRNPEYDHAAELKRRALYGEEDEGEGAINPWIYDSPQLVIADSVIIEEIKVNPEEA